MLSGHLGMNKIHPGAGMAVFPVITTRCGAGMLLCDNGPGDT